MKLAEMETQTAAMQMKQPEVVTRAEWLVARKDFLSREKEFTRQGDALSAARRRLPMVRVEQNYVFDGPDGKQALSDLFAGKSQLIVYHFMLGPDWEEGCKSCSYLADHFDGARLHLTQRDVSLVVVSRAPVAVIDGFKKRMGWSFNWVSSHESEFNFDYHVSFTKEEEARNEVDYNYGKKEFMCEELPGLSVFYKNENGEIFHSYSCYARGLDHLIGTYHFLDLVPKGRDEATDSTMSWVRHHDRY